MSATDVINAAQELRAQGVRAVALQTHLEVGNESESVAALSNSEEGHAATLVRGAVVESLVLAIQRMSDPGRSDKVTLAKVAELIQAPATRPDINRLSSAADVDAFLAAVAALDASGALKRLRAVRNYRVAHLIPSKNAQAFYDDLSAGLQVVLDATYLLVVCTGISSVAFAAEKQVWEERTRTYWRRLMDGPSVPARTGGPMRHAAMAQP
jgi:hypothetical protein